MADNKFRFTNEKCPVCNSTFKEDDDIAVCPECGTPHHRECFKENKHCANHEKHSENFRWEPDFVTPDTMELPKVKADKQTVQDEEPAFFSMQINNLPKLLDGIYEDFDEEVTAEDMALFVRQNANKYVYKFQKIKSKKPTWNWAAFIFAPYWFFYRKMYKLGAIFLALTLLLPIGVSAFPSTQTLLQDMSLWTEKYNPETIQTLTEQEIIQANEELTTIVQKNPAGVVLVFSQSALYISLGLLIGFTANKWYYNYALKSIKKIKAEEKIPQNQKILFLQRGGTSVGGFFLAVMANDMLVMAAEMLLTFIK